MTLLALMEWSRLLQMGTMRQCLLMDKQVISNLSVTGQIRNWVLISVNLLLKAQLFSKGQSCVNRTVYSTYRTEHFKQILNCYSVWFTCAS